MPWQSPGDSRSGGPKRKGSGNSPFDKLVSQFAQGGSGNWRIMIVALFVLAAVWVASGFYTIKESDRGVVLRFGKYIKTVEPGLNWKPTFIDKVYKVNISTTQSFSSSGLMLTRDENVIQVELNVQFRVSDPYKYLFSVTNANESLKQATDSALRYVVGHTTMDDVMTKGRQKVKEDTWNAMNNIIAAYDMGITVLDVNMLPARAPDQVKAAFDDAIAAQEDEQTRIREAEAYAREIKPKAVGRVQRMTAEAEAYARRVVLTAEGDVARFKAMLPEYNAAPEITKRRMFLETMEDIYAATPKVMVDLPKGSGSMIYLPVDKLMEGRSMQPSAQNQGRK